MTPTDKETEGFLRDRFHMQQEFSDFKNDPVLEAIEKFTLPAKPFNPILIFVAIAAVSLIAVIWLTFPSPGEKESQKNPSRTITDDTMDEAPKFDLRQLVDDSMLIVVGTVKSKSSDEYHPELHHVEVRKVIGPQLDPGEKNLAVITYARKGEKRSNLSPFSKFEDLFPDKNEVDWHSHPEGTKLLLFLERFRKVHAKNEVELFYIPVLVDSVFTVYKEHGIDIVNGPLGIKSLNQTVQAVQEQYNKLRMEDVFKLSDVIVSAMISEVDRSAVPRDGPIKVSCKVEEVLWGFNVGKEIVFNHPRPYRDSKYELFENKNVLLHLQKTWYGKFEDQIFLLLPHWNIPIQVIAKETIECSLGKLSLEEYKQTIQKLGKEEPLRINFLDVRSPGKKELHPGAFEVQFELQNYSSSPASIRLESSGKNLRSLKISVRVDDDFGGGGASKTIEQFIEVRGNNDKKLLTIPSQGKWRGVAKFSDGIPEARTCWIKLTVSGVRTRTGQILKSMRCPIEKK